MSSNTLTALIVDDDAYVRGELKQLLSAHPHVAVVGEAATLNKARQLLRELSAQVVFLDIELRDGSGFELVPALAPGTEIIFVTAFDQFAVRAFEVNALDYLVKPLNPGRLAESLARLGRKTSVAMPPLEPADRVFLRYESGQRFVGINEIVAITSLGGNYCTVELSDGSAPTVRRPLKEWEQALRASHCRIHRGSIVSVASIDRLERHDESSLALYLRHRAQPLLISRRRAAQVRKLLATLGAALDAR